MPALLDHLSSVREPRARAAKARRFLEQAPPEDAVAAMFDAIVRARTTAAAPAVLALDAIAVALTLDEGVSYRAASALYVAAQTADLAVVARLFFSASAAAASASPPADAPAVERPVHPRGEPMPLGTRTWLARRSPREAVTELVRDPHPAVIANLLKSPAITERDVLAVASRRPTQPDCQIAVFADDRWRARHAVRRALALNPHTPVPLAARIMTTLRSADLRDVAQDGNLAATLRRHARELRALAG